MSTFLQESFSVDNEYNIDTILASDFILIFAIKLPLHLTLGSIPAIQIVVF